MAKAKVTKRKAAPPTSNAATKAREEQRALAAFLRTEKMIAKLADQVGRAIRNSDTRIAGLRDFLSDRIRRVNLEIGAQDAERERTIHDRNPQSAGV